MGSMYTEDYLDTAEANRWTVGTFLSYTLRGKAKGYSARYQAALMKDLLRLEAAGEVIRVDSAKGGTAWIRVGSVESAERNAEAS